MAGLIKPMLGRPLAAACWLARAANPAHNGVEALEPPMAPCLPLSATSQMETSAWQDTSGMLRMVVDPWLADMPTPCCQVGIGNVALIPPPLPDHVVSA